MLGRRQGKGIFIFILSIEVSVHTIVKCKYYEDNIFVAITVALRTLLS